MLIIQLRYIMVVWCFFWRFLTAKKNIKQKLKPVVLFNFIMVVSNRNMCKPSFTRFNLSKFCIGWFVLNTNVEMGVRVNVCRRSHIPLCSVLYIYIGDKSLQMREGIGVIVVLHISEDWRADGRRGLFFTTVLL